MAFLTTNPNPYILNLPSLQNVVNSASGSTASLSASLTNIQTYINTGNASVSINTLKTYNNTSYINVLNNLNLSNSAILMNGATSLTANTVNGTGYLAFQTSGVERGRFTTAGLGVGVASPQASVDVNGSELIRGSLYISTMGAPISPTLGNLYADGNLYANGTFYPSDIKLKQNVVPYISPGLPTPVRFEWKATGKADIGVIANEVAKIEPACVQSTPSGTLTVDYSKLTVLLLAEVQTLKTQVTALEAQVQTLLRQ